MIRCARYAPGACSRSSPTLTRSMSMAPAIIRCGVGTPRHAELPGGRYNILLAGARRAAAELPLRSSRRRGGAMRLEPPVRQAAGRSFRTGLYDGIHGLVRSITRRLNSDSRGAPRARLPICAPITSYSMPGQNDPGAARSGARSSGDGSAGDAAAHASGRACQLSSVVQPVPGSLPSRPGACARRGID
jgi:hypothetical protein